MEEKKLEKKTRIKEWTMVIGTIVLVAVASIIAYNYGLKKSTPKDSIKVDNPTNEEQTNNEEKKNNENIEYTSITSKEYNELDSIDGYYSITDLGIKVDSDTSEVFNEIHHITFNNGKILTIDGGIYKLDFKKIGDYLLIRETATSDDVTKFSAYDFNGNEIKIENNLDYSISGAFNPEISSDKLDSNDLYMIVNYSNDNEKYGGASTIEDKELVKKYCNNESILLLYVNVIEKDGELNYNTLDYSCRQANEN